MDSELYLDFVYADLSGICNIYCTVIWTVLHFYVLLCYKEVEEAVVWPLPISCSTFDNAQQEETVQYG